MTHKQLDPSIKSRDEIGGTHGDRYRVLPGIISLRTCMASQCTNQEYNVTVALFERPNWICWENGCDRRSVLPKPRSPEHRAHTIH